jgi:hypothetical protein
MDSPLTNEQERFMRWLEEDVTGHSPEAPVPPEWHRLREEAGQLSEFLRNHLPTDREPPAADRFNDDLRRRLA